MFPPPLRSGGNDMFDKTQFAHKHFSKESWEDEVKNLISSLSINDGVLWYKKHRSLKKINEELVTLGYYNQNKSYKRRLKMTFISVIIKSIISINILITYCN